MVQGLVGEEDEFSGVDLTSELKFVPSDCFCSLRMDEDVHRH
jgi:hypothetical protein